MDSIDLVLLAGIIFLGVAVLIVGSNTLRRQEQVAQRNFRNLSLGGARLQQVQAFANESSALIDRQDIDPAVFAQMLRRALALLHEIETEISVASENVNEYALDNFQNLLTAYNVLRTFCEQSLEVWERKFGEMGAEPSETPDYGGEPEDLSRTAAETMKRADRNVSTARRRLVTS